MKHLIFVLGFSLLTLNAHALETVISSRTVTLPVELSSSTVRLSAAGYSMPLVKVLIPALASVTIMDHRNLGEAAPCMSTVDTKDPARVLLGKEGLENIDFKIELVRTAEVDHQNVCRVHLIEKVTAQIRKLHFTHERFAEMPSRVAEDCK